MIRLYMIVLLTIVVQVNVFASDSNVYRQSVNAPMEKVYPRVYESLENARFYVVLEPNISKNLQRFSEKWGENYNQSHLSSIRSMVFCNAWYANAVSNSDPVMLALCPLRIGLYEKKGKTTVVFAKPTVIAEHSPAIKILQEVEAEVIKAIEQGIKGLRK